jgi:hypothetical protein
MTRRILLVIMVLCGLGWTSLSHGATRYSSPSGGRSTCSSSSPCSLSTGLSQTAAGDTLILLDGTYNIPGDQMWSPSGSSESTRPIIKAQHFRQAVLQCTNYAGGCGINFTGAWVQIENLVFRDSSVSVDAQHVRLKGVEVGWCSGNCIGLFENPSGDSPTFLEMIDLYVHDCGWRSDHTKYLWCFPEGWAQGHGSGDCHSFYNNSDDVLIEGGVWVASDHFSLHAHPSGANYANRWTIRNVTFTFRDCRGSGGEAIILQGSRGGPHWVYNNVFHGMCAPGGSGLLIAGTPGVTAVNNTFYNMNVPIIVEGGSPTIRNNLFANSHKTIQVRRGSYTGDHNATVGTGISQRAGSSSPAVSLPAGHSSFGVSAPGVVLRKMSADIADLCRTVGPQIINKGDPSVLSDGVTTDYAGVPRPQGGGVDIGALECDSSSLPILPQLPAPTAFTTDVPPPQGCVSLTWQYPDGIQELALFRLYIRDDQHAYATGQPIATIPAKPHMTTHQLCRDVSAPHKGPWKAVVVAASADLTESDRSNEIEVVFSQAPNPPPRRQPSRPRR